jgi:hypothetical protein
LEDERVAVPGEAAVTRSAAVFLDFLGAVGREFISSLVGLPGFDGQAMETEFRLLMLDDDGRRVEPRSIGQLALLGIDHPDPGKIGLLRRGGDEEDRDGQENGHGDGSMLVHVHASDGRDQSGSLSARVKSAPAA